NNKDFCDFQLPSWRPGRYQIQNFAKNVRNFQAFTANSKPLFHSKVDKNTWRVTTEVVEEIKVSYSYLARHMDAGGTWIDETQWYINFINCAMLVNGEGDKPCEVLLEIPDSWQVAGSLQKIAPKLLKATNYFELVDSPIIASSSLQHFEYTCSNTLFHIWFQGKVALDDEKLLNEFKKFTAYQIKLFGTFPTETYHFLFQILPYSHYHGVEHAKSTVITLGPDYAFNTEKVYADFLGVSSHELFHTWNVTRLRPVEMMPYNFFKENYFETGFIAEGITTYYGDYILKCSGVFTTRQYLQEINKLLKRHFLNRGRFHGSLTDSSVDLWLDGYEKGITGRKVSIYVKGALTAMILDLQLRFDSNGEKSLDAVIQTMWKKFAQSGYTIEDYKAVVNDIADNDMYQYFKGFIEGTLPIENTLSLLLPAFGLNFKKKQADSYAAKHFGLQLNINKNSITISDLAEGSPAANCLEIGDEIVALNNVKPDKNHEIIFQLHREITVHLFRNNSLKKILLKSDASHYYETYEVEINKDADAQSVMLRKGWLGEL
ncbi:MAG: M61 family peptidase, partial [Bacteroidota bacterium]